ncbi:MAG: diaminopimelate epimerase [Candidatus Margulisbacteria bacterium]|nr:diaminopimelate epimerase [Candidatus Margulisiibacteriota bacterium]
MQPLAFHKYHGLGNDFILIDARKEKLDGCDLKKLAIDLCDRHFGIGADGLLIVWSSSKAHFRLQIINPDGSEAEMCGNGIRCFAKYVYETDKLTEEIISVETPAGIILPTIIPSSHLTISIVEVDMGIPIKIKDQKLKIKNNEYDISEISMGNPHAVILVDDLDAINISEIGPQIENHPHFPHRTNVEFVKVINDKEIDIKVWERGAGETMACGTGACAASAAASLQGKVGRKVIAHLPGGNLEIEWNDDNHILMRGPAEKVFEGKVLL